MGNDIDKLIAHMVQIFKYVSLQSNLTFEERTATMLQYHTLAYLKEHPESKLTDVAKHLNASLSSTTQLIERMHKGGLIERKGDDKDRRITLLRATNDGIEKLKFLKESKRNRMKELLSHIDKEDIKQLVRILQKLADNITTKK